MKPVVLSVAFPYAVVGPRAVGGAEVVCSQMERAVEEASEYRSVVVAHAGSEPCGVLYGTAVPEGEITERVRAEVERAHQANIDRALREHPVAVVHMHGLDFQRYRIPEGIPVVVTVHLPPGWYAEPLDACPAEYTLVCVSETQRRACAEAVQGRVRVIENGVPLPDRGVLRAEGRYAVMLARICPEKNVHVGLEAARLAGMPVVLGGEVFPYEAHERYFREEVLPRVSRAGATHEERARQADGPVARFVGPVGAAEKTRLLSRAACLLLPSLALETSSLVAMEALAAGVPVVGMRVGAVPEIVDDGVTGWLVEPGEGATDRMAEAIGAVARLHRARCREVAEERFPLERMVEAYLALYREVGREVEVAAPVAVLEEVPERGVARELTVEWVTDAAGLARCVPEWTGLWSAVGTSVGKSAGMRDERATPFQHPAWLLPWWRQFGPDGELRAMWVRDAARGEALAFVPLYLYAETAQLLLVGAGTSDVLDGVWGVGSAAVADRVVRELMAMGAGASLRVSLFQLRAGSPLVGALERAGVALREAEALSVIAMEKELPAKLRANVRRYERRAAPEGELRFEVAATVEDALDGFEALARMQRVRWTARGEGGVLEDARVMRHNRESVPLLLEAGLLRMFRLFLGERLLGVLYAMAEPAGRRLLLYLIGFEDGYAELSPGTLLLHRVWLYARAEGFAVLDLLRGGEAYKRLWGAEQEPMLAAEREG